MAEYCLLTLSLSLIIIIEVFCAKRAYMGNPTLQIVHLEGKFWNKTLSYILLLINFLFKICASIHHMVLNPFTLLQVRCFKVVDSLLSKQNAGMSKHNKDNLFSMNAVIPHKTSQQAHTRLVTTLELPSLFYKHGLLPNIHVTSLLQLNKYMTSVNTLQSLQAFHATFVTLQ